MNDNPQIETARRYIEQTGISLFLTGKAGTGKTTFLHEIDRTTTKRHAVVAPTGVAAINAGGVTIHSFFQLPFDPYLPDVKELATEYQMPHRHKSLNKTKQNIIRTLELLIIDEISMVRADLLDAIDMTLRRVRRSSLPFGGVQLLLIGDVHQLAPVVTEQERPFLEQVYPSPYFFASKALARLPYATIELTTVYRQQDADFVALLNQVRDNHITPATLDLLNSRLHAPQHDAITLTTHIRQADAINHRHLEALHGESRTFEAAVSGNYPDRSFPCPRTLHLKVGERVMFIKNDSSGSHRYYNGKLGTILSFRPDEEGGLDRVVVADDDGDTVATGREVWENLRYELNPDTNEIVQEVDGRFEQYPLQPAWAVTIHKAQGLTFDRVVVDAADAFAFGQVYVALSRCRSLEGLSLSSPLSPSVAFSDSSVSRFVEAQPSFADTVAAVAHYEQQYRIEKLMELFGIDTLLHECDLLLRHFYKVHNLYPDQLADLQLRLQQLHDLQDVAERFKAQLMRLDETRQDERARQGADYFHSQLLEVRQAVAADVDVEIDNKENRKAVAEAADQLGASLGLKLACLAAVCRQGYSVAAVQKARTDYLLAANQPSASRRRSHKLSASAGNTSNPTLVERLRHWRSQKAAELKVPPYVVLQQKALLAIAEHKPATAADLARLNGVGPATVKRYGEAILALVGETPDEG